VLTILSEGPIEAEHETAVERGCILASGVGLARDLINQPPNHMTPRALAEVARTEACAAGCTVNVLDADALAAQGLGGLVAIGAGRANPPCLVEIIHEPDVAHGNVALVGKGVTYDAGGLTLKARLQMETMKGDMSGAAAAIGAAVTLARLGTPIRMRTWVACAENMPGAKTARPGDVVTMSTGKTVEILFPDAEGRIVLADAIGRALRERVDALIDIGTVTGAGKFLGRFTGGLMGNDTALRDHIMGAAAVAGEDFWPMPLPDYMRPTLRSRVADLANVVADGDIDPNMITVGLFLREFVPPDVPWAHLDIPFFNFGPPVGDMASGAIGFGTRTLVYTIEGLAAHHLSAGIRAS
jgi:leucyl aminopeptidase